MKRFGLLLIALFLYALAPLEAQVKVFYNDVMLIINDGSTTSVEIGNYFATRRNIPAGHICHINVSASESMDSATFLPLKWQIQSWMQSHNLVDSINYIVTTKGCPLRVTTPTGDDNTNHTFGGLCSFEDCLVLINGSDSTAILSSRDLNSFPGSRYFNSVQHFKRSKDLPMYLVTRLDGYTVDQIKGYIQKAETPAVLGDGLWVLDVDPGRDNPGYGIGNDWLRTANTTLTLRSMNVFLDTTDTYVHNQTGVIGYGSWGSNDGHSGGGAEAKPGNTWLNGAIAETYVSTGGRSFMAGTGYGQSLIADWIAEGVSGIKGYTDEPYLFSMAHTDILFDRYTSGYNMAESFYAASQVIAWRQVIIGDPKMQLLQLMATVSTANLGKGPRYAPLRDTIWIHNNFNGEVIVSAPQFVGKDSLDFQASLLNGKTFPQTVAAYDSLGVIIICNPTRYASENATLHFPFKRSTDQKSFDLSVSLFGTGTKPVLTTPDTVRFAGPMGTPVTQAVTVQKATPSDTLIITRLVLSGSGASAFALDNSIKLPDTLTGNETWDIPLVYSASGAAQDAAALQITSTSNKGVQQVQLRGSVGTSSVDMPAVALGSGSAILSTYPNPFTSSAEIGYYVAEGKASVRLEVFDPLGHRVRLLKETAEQSGEHSVIFNAGDLAAGTYICRLTVTTDAGISTTSVRPLIYSK